MRSFTPCLSILLGKRWVVSPGLAQIQRFPVCVCMCGCVCVCVCVFEYFSELYLGYLNINEPCIKTAVSNYCTPMPPCSFLMGKIPVCWIFMSFYGKSRLYVLCEILSCSNVFSRRGVIILIIDCGEGSHWWPKLFSALNFVLHSLYTCGNILMDPSSQEIYDSKHPALYNPPADNLSKDRCVCSPKNTDEWREM